MAPIPKTNSCSRFERSRSLRRVYGYLRVAGIAALVATAGCRSSANDPKADDLSDVLQPVSESAAEIRPTDVVGKWQATTDGGTCGVYMTMIKWEDGHRATARKCRTGDLKSLRSWKIQGSEIALEDDSAGLIGILKMSDANELQGQFMDGSRFVLARDGDAEESAEGGSVSSARAQNRKLQQTDLLGSWRVGGDGDECGLFLTMTSAPNGFRASSRSCEESNLQQISAWRLKGERIVLLDDKSRNIARLERGSGDTFSGRLVNGNDISISR